MSWFNESEAIKALRNGTHCDFTINCKGHAFKAHKIILATKSEFFRACTEGEFKESKDATVDLPEEDPYVVAMALIYIYGGRFEGGDVKDIWPLLPSVASEDGTYVEWNMSMLVKLYKLSDCLMLPSLGDQVEKSIFDTGDMAKTLYYDRWNMYANGGSDWLADAPGSRSQPKNYKQNVQARALATLHLLKTIYAEAPELNQLRARATVAGLQVYNTLAGDDSIGEEIGDLLQLHENVAWRTAAHFAGEMDELKSLCDDRLSFIGRFRNLNMDDTAGDWGNPGLRSGW